MNGLSKRRGRTAWTSAWTVRRIGCAVFLTAGLLATAAPAQQPAAAGSDVARAAARRFPQPVRVGALVGRQVLQPLESMPTLGWVRGVVGGQDGNPQVIVDYGGRFRLERRPVAVPAAAMALLGQYLEIVDFTPEQIGAFPTFDVAAAQYLPPDTVIRVGLARPSH